MADRAADRWLDWLVRGRDADDAELRRRTAEMLLPIRDKVLDGAPIRPGDTVLDVGTGEGLLGIGALERVGEAGRVLFTDVSAPLLERVRTAVEALGATGRSGFHVTPAETLAAISDRSADVVVARSVLIYVADRRAALASFARVLRPGGRVCLHEPVSAFFLAEDSAPGVFFGWDVGDAAEPAARVTDFYRETADGTPPSMLSLSAHALVRDAEAAGFGDVTATLTATSRRHAPGDDAVVRRVLHGRPNPAAPSPAETARAVLTPAEADRFTAALERAVRAGRGHLRLATVLLRATSGRS
jgi:arsenite methyltransferase